MFSGDTAGLVCSNAEAWRVAGELWTDLGAGMQPQWWGVMGWRSRKLPKVRLSNRINVGAHGIGHVMWYLWGRG